MAERRMFAKTIIDSDMFLEMPLSTQALYFHLSMRADDDGFINSPKRIQRLIGCSDDDLKLLILKKFILVFDNGVIVIKHWKIHNYIQKDRYKETMYKEQKEQLYLDENNSYTLNETDKKVVGYNMDTQVRLGKSKVIVNNVCNTCESDEIICQRNLDYKNETCSSCWNFKKCKKQYENKVINEALEHKQNKEIKKESIEDLEKYFKGEN